MRFIILFGTLAIALPFLISGIASRYGSAVAERFLERPGAVPEELGGGAILTHEKLYKWATAPATSADAKGYAHRVLPVDLLYLIFLGGFLGLAASTVSSSIVWPMSWPAIPVWTWWLLPLTYVVCDVLEDSLIIFLLSWPSFISQIGLDCLSVLRFLKIYSVGLSMALVVALCGLSIILV